jgi:hypothetical protein
MQDARYMRLISWTLQSGSEQYLQSVTVQILITFAPCSSVVRWPKFRPKSSKEAGENKVGRKNLCSNFGRILPKVAEKGPRKFSKEVSY